MNGPWALVWARGRRRSCAAVSPGEVLSQTWSSIGRTEERQVTCRVGRELYMYEADEMHHLGPLRSLGLAHEATYWRRSSRNVASGYKSCSLLDGCASSGGTRLSSVCLAACGNPVSGKPRPSAAKSGRCCARALRNDARRHRPAGGHLEGWRSAIVARESAHGGGYWSGRCRAWV